MIIYAQPSVAQRELSGTVVVPNKGPDPVSQGPAPRTGVITVTLHSKAEFYQAWMPFIRGGGLFVPSSRACALGDEVFLLVSLPQEPTKLALRGHVVWINPENQASGRPRGFGVGLEGEPAADGLRLLAARVLVGSHEASSLFR